jgi:hypothetical protein
LNVIPSPASSQRGEGYRLEEPQSEILAAPQSPAALGMTRRPPLSNSLLTHDPALISLYTINQISYA